jgi:hypothetical protein
MRKLETQGGHIRWECRCDCNGTIIPVFGYHLQSKHTTSCGCYVSELVTSRNTKHGHARREEKTREYGIWKGMIKRCTNPNTRQYENYGARGIAIEDPRWFEFPLFYADMGPCPSGMTIERKNNSRGYSLENCVWATMTQQARNTRKNLIVEYQGKKMCFSEAIERSGEKHNTILSRMNRRGCTFEDAIGDILFVPHRWSNECFNKKLEELFDKLKSKPDQSASSVLIFP